MDPRLVDVLRTLLSIVMEPSVAAPISTQDPYAPPNDAQHTQYAPGSYGHFWEQLQGPRQHQVWPFPDTNFGGV